MEDHRLYSYNLIGFIPPFRTSRKGIVRNVPLDLTNESILESANSPITIIAVNRLTRKVARNQTKGKNIDNNSTEYTLSYTITVTFEGQKIPKYITLFHVSYPVSPYISRVTLCHSCLRYGHIKDLCKSQPRCAHCGDKGHSFSKEHCPRSQEPPRCVNCKGAHRADSFSCPEYAIQREIREYAAYKNVSLLDARDIIRDRRSPPAFSSSSDEFLPLSSSYNEYNNSPTSRASRSFASRFSPQSYVRAAEKKSNFSSRSSTLPPLQKSCYASSSSLNSTNPSSCNICNNHKKSSKISFSNSSSSLTRSRSHSDFDLDINNNISNPELNLVSLLQSLMAVLSPTFNSLGVSEETRSFCNLIQNKHSDKDQRSPPSERSSWIITYQKIKIH